MGKGMEGEGKGEGKKGTGGREGEGGKRKDDLHPTLFRPCHPQQLRIWGSAISSPSGVRARSRGR